MHAGDEDQHRERPVGREAEPHREPGAGADERDLAEGDETDPPDKQAGGRGDDREDRATRKFFTQNVDVTAGSTNIATTKVTTTITAWMAARRPRRLGMAIAGCRPAGRADGGHRVTRPEISPCVPCEPQHHDDREHVRGRLAVLRRPVPVRRVQLGLDEADHERREEPSPTATASGRSAPAPSAGITKNVIVPMSSDPNRSLEQQPEDAEHHSRSEPGDRLDLAHRHTEQGRVVTIVGDRPHRRADLGATEEDRHAADDQQREQHRDDLGPVDAGIEDLEPSVPVGRRNARASWLRQYH